MAEYDAVSVDSNETTLYESNFANATHALIHAALDLSGLQNGDTFVVRVYRKVNGTDYVREDAETFSGVQSNPLIPIGPVWASGAMDLKVTAQKTAGTDRTIGIRKRGQF